MFESEPTFINEQTPLLESEDYIDDTPQYQETSFGGYDPTIQQEATQATLRALEANIEKMDIQINALERNFNVKIPPDERKRFRLRNGYLQIERSAGEYVNITKSNGEFLAASTLRSRLGSSLARRLLGIETPKVVKTRSRLLLDMIPTEREMEDLSLNKIKEVIDEVTRNVGTNTDLDMREILGLDKALTRIDGELTNNASKLSEVDEHLKKERGKLAEIKNDPEYGDELRQRLKKRIAELEEERSARLEILSQNKKALTSQFARIRQTVEKILDEDKTLREKIKLVFREHGLTITAVLTSIGLIISTIIGFLTGGGSSGVSQPPNKPNKLKEWIKGKLKALARVLGRAISAALNFLKKIVTSASEHVWLFLTITSVTAGYIIYDSFKVPKNKK